MARFVVACIVVFVVALVFLIVSSGHDLTPILDAYRAEPLPQKFAWVVLVLVPLVLLPASVWLSDSLARQRKVSGLLELRLDGVRKGVTELAKSQADADAALRHLARTDPEDAISAVQERLIEAERVLQVQQSRNEIGDLQTRVDSLRTQQEALQQRLAPVLDKRRFIEQLFTDLDTRQNDVDRALAEIVSADDATALDLRLKNFADFVRGGHERCEEIEAAAKTVAGLKQDFAGLRTRLEPLAGAEDGLPQRVKDLSAAMEALTGDIEALQHTRDGSLAERLHKFAGEKEKLDDGVAQLDKQFQELATLRKEIDGLFANFDRALGLLSISPGKDAGARIDELSAYIKTTQSRLDDVESRRDTFAQLKTRLTDLQSRLTPLEAGDSGVVSLLEQLTALRDGLVGRVSRIEQGDDGDLASRVKMFADARKELEERVASATEQFSKLAAIRKDLAGLAEKLSSAATASSN